MKIRRTFSHDRVVWKNGGRPYPSLANSHLFREFPDIPAGKGALVSCDSKIMVVEPVDIDSQDVEGPVSPQIIRLARQATSGRKLTDNKIEMRMRKKYVSVGKSMTVRRDGESPSDMKQVGTVKREKTPIRISIGIKMLRNILTAFPDDDSALAFEIESPVAILKITHTKTGAYALMMPRRD